MSEGGKKSGRNHGIIIIVYSFRPEWVIPAKMAKEHLKGSRVAQISASYIAPSSEELLVCKEQF